MDGADRSSGKRRRTKSMEARIPRAVLLAAALLVSMGASYRTPNFIVTTQDPQFAAQMGQAAEQYRRDLAVSWLGHSMPDWAQPCPMTVQAAPHLGAGGATTFVFDRGEVFGWRMTIQGSRERLLDSVLPHEISHMVFATHFRRPLPRWADEGGATTVEHASERAKHKRMLVQFLRTGRGIAFNRMFAMTEYPRDIMPLYAQGYTLAELLIQKGGRREYVAFLADGMRDDHWSAAVKKHYGIANLGVLQNTWLAWVGQGFPEQRPPAAVPEATPSGPLLALGDKRARPAPNLIHHVSGPARLVAAAGPAMRPNPYRPGSIASVQVLPADGWHARGTHPVRDPQVVAAVATSPAGPARSEVARPQPAEPTQQIILDPGRPAPRPSATAPQYVPSN